MPTQSKGHEIAKAFFMSGYVDPKEGLASLIDAAITEAEQNKVRECAEKAIQFINSRFLIKGIGAVSLKSNGDFAAELSEEILSLIAPPVPVWCGHCKLDKSGVWRFYSMTEPDGFRLHDAITICPLAGCGAPRPAMKEGVTHVL